MSFKYPVERIEYCKAAGKTRIEDTAFRLRICNRSRIVLMFSILCIVHYC